MEIKKHPRKSKLIFFKGHKMKYQIAYTILLMYYNGTTNYFAHNIKRNFHIGYVQSSLQHNTTLIHTIEPSSSVHSMQAHMW